MRFQILYRFPDKSASNCSIVCSSTPAAPRLDLTALYASYTRRLSIWNGLFVARLEIILFPVVSVMQLPDPTPSLQPYYRAFIAVGSEVARLRASHRPPLKRGVRFSRAPLSRRCAPAGSQRWYQSHQVHKPVLSVQNGHRQLLQAAVPPTAKSVRPD